MADPRRITLLLPRLLGGGGLDRTTMRLAEGLVDHGRRVDVVFVDGAYPTPAVAPPGVNVIDLGARRASHALPGLVGYLRRARPWALLGAMPVANLLALAARELSRVPTVVVIKEHNTVSELLPTGTGPKNAALRWLLRRLYPRADATVAISRGVAVDLARVAGLEVEDIEVIHNPVITPAFAAAARPPAGHPWFDDARTTPVIVTVARLAAQKDVGTLLAAFERVRASRPARLAVLGEGPERSDLERAVERAGLGDDVWMPGFVPDPQRHLARADAFVLSSRYEGLANVVVEALAAGAPVVSTDCPSGPREILRDGELGRLVPVGDAAAMARAIEAVLDDPPPPAPSEALARFETATAVNRYLALLEQLPARRPGARAQRRARPPARP